MLASFIHNYTYTKNYIVLAKSLVNIRLLSQTSMTNILYHSCLSIDKRSLIFVSVNKRRYKFLCTFQLQQRVWRGTNKVLEIRNKTDIIWNKWNRFFKCYMSDTNALFVHLPTNDTLVSEVKYISFEYTHRIISVNQNVSYCLPLSNTFLVYVQTSACWSVS